MLRIMIVPVVAFACVSMLAGCASGIKDESLMLKAQTAPDAELKVFAEPAVVRQVLAELVELEPKSSVRWVDEKNELFVDVWARPPILVPHWPNGRIRYAWAASESVTVVLISSSVGALGSPAAEAKAAAPNCVPLLKERTSLLREFADAPRQYELYRIGGIAHAKVDVGEGQVVRAIVTK